MRILFWGTSEFAVPSLLALDGEGFEIVGVVTRPDRPAGRGRRLTPSAVKQVALEQGLELLTPDRPRGDDFLEAIRSLEPDLSVVVAYGHILRREILDLPRAGSINVHASLLPALRGAAPINWAIARGHTETGVTIMRMVEAMDAGPIIHQVREPIFPDETASELSTRLSELGAEALIESLALLATGAAEEVAQDDELATYAPKIDRETARIDWNRPADEVALMIRAMDASPGAWSTLGGAPIKLFRPQVVPELPDVSSLATPASNGGPPPPGPDPEPGSVLEAEPSRGVVVAAVAGGILITEAQPPGSRRMAASDWINGRGVEVGQRFE